MTRKMKNKLNIPEEIKDDLVSFLAGKMDETKANSLLHWLSEDVERKKFFEQIKQIWHSSAIVNNSDKFNSKIAWNDIVKELEKSQVKNKNRRLIAWSGYKIAVSIAASLIAGIFISKIWFGETKTLKNNYIEMVAPLGSRSELTLPDGTKVWLNSGSKITFTSEFGTSTRYLNLEGEAYFKVAKNKKIPFIVHAADLNITALGTAFNVKAYNEEKLIETTLEEGSIKIENTKKVKDKRVIYLRPKQKAVYNKTSTPVIVNTEEPEIINNKPITKKIELVPVALKIDSVPDTRIYTSWKEPRWIFRHEALKNLAVKLERKYDVSIVFKDSYLKDYSFSGSLQDESIEQVFEAIKMVAPIDYKISHKTIELSTNKTLKKKYEKLNY
jgi:ferric-dicitrate binding protein FerR (iron transport regulator)